MRHGLTFGPLVLATAAFNCVAHQEVEVRTASRALFAEPGWVMVDGVPVIREAQEAHAGAAALAMVLAKYDVQETPSSIASTVGPYLNARDLQHYAESRGLSGLVFVGTLDEVVRHIDEGRPVIVGSTLHYEVVVGYHPTSRRLATIDPVIGFTEIDARGFIDSNNDSRRVAVVVAPPLAREAHALR